MASVREQIMQAVVSALQAIGTSGTYEATEVPNVTRDEVAWEDTPLPTIYVAGASEEYDRNAAASFPHYVKTMTIKFAYVSDYDADTYDADEYRASMVADVERALADWTLGGACTQLDLVSNATQVYDPSDTTPTMCVEFEARIQYRIRRDKPQTRI